MKDLRVIAITHQDFPLETISRFQLSGPRKIAAMNAIRKLQTGGEVMYLATCNRVEIIFTASHFICSGYTSQVLQIICPEMPADEIQKLADKVKRYGGEEACHHILRLVSSLDSIVIGEREIITQFRKAFEESREAGLTGDVLRIMTRQAIETAKQIFTQTALSRKPVSVVSVAWNEFRSHNLSENSPILLVGAGQVIGNFMKFLHENGFKNLTVSNRTMSHAEELALQFGADAVPYSDLKEIKKKFSTIISCTASQGFMIDLPMFESLTDPSFGKRIIVDLALPADIDPQICERHDVISISMETVKELAGKNLESRKEALEECETILLSGLEDLENTWMEREIELAMKSIPGSIREIKEVALGSVFAKDIEQLDPHSKELLLKILNYMEKKYISIPMKMAKEVLLENIQKN